MPKSVLFHKRKFDGDMSLVSEVNMADYEAVAVINIPGAERDNNVYLHMAYQYTNSIDSHWSNNERVVALKPRCRSTSIGDVILLNNTYFVCAPLGWHKVNNVKGFVE